MPRTLAVRAARAAAEKQGRDILVLQVRDLIAITDYFVIASGATDRQVKAIGDSVEDELRRSGAKPIRREGERDNRWLLLDFADLIVHVFHEEDRAYYELERLWKDAPSVRWEPAAAKAKATKAKAKSAQR
jgi:ribosome-associated protein